MFKFLGFLLDALFPVPKLPENIRLYDTLFCPVCLSRLPAGKMICHKNSGYLLGAAARYNNEKTVRKMIWQLKYRGRSGHASPLAGLLVSYIKNCKFNIKNFAVVPMPLSKKRLAWRGYNQAALIAERVSANFSLPLLGNALVRVQDAPPQAELKDWNERSKNVENCFGAADAALVAGKSVILIDDVFTSGSTMNEAVKTLKAAGAKQVLGLVIARAR